MTVETVAGKTTFKKETCRGPLWDDCGRELTLVLPLIARDATDRRMECKECGTINSLQKELV